MTTQQNVLLTSSNEEPDLKWTAPRAPLSMPRNISPSERYEYIHVGTEIKKIERDFDQLSRRFDRVMHKRAYSPKSSASKDDLNELFPELFVDSPSQQPKDVAHYPISHEKGNCCDKLSCCIDCVTLNRLVKSMNKLPNQIEEIVEQYYYCLGKMPTHQFCARVNQDKLTFAKQNAYMRAQLVRGLQRYDKHIATKFRTGMLREFMIEDKDNKQQTIERARARDQKYESKFVAQGLGPIEHARGACDEDFSMCIDCLSSRKCYAIMKRCPDRANAAYSFLWRTIEIMPTQQCQLFANATKHWMNMATYAEVTKLLQTYFIYSLEMGPNYYQKSLMYEAIKARQLYLEKRTGVSNDSPALHTKNMMEKPFVAQAFATIDFNIPSLDRITDMLSRLITDNNINVNVGEWTRRLASFVLMLIQLCAESTLFIKVTAVAQFMTHFNLPGLSVFRGYAQQLAQVFQTAIERMRGRPRWNYDFQRNLETDVDEEDEIVFDAEGPFRAQNDDTKVAEGVLMGTSKLFLAMAGITDYDIKANAPRIARIDQLSRTIMSTERLTQFVVKLFKYAYEIASVHVFGVHPDMRELALVSERIPKWMDTVMAYYNNEGLVRVTKNVDEARTVMKWQRQGDEYNALLWKFKTIPKAYAIFKNVHNMCDRLYQAASPYLAESAMRVSPFSVLITGGPGLGKSVMQYSFITDVMTDAFRRRGLVYKPGEQIYVHTSGGKHWDGYREQTVVCVDDVFQSMDPQETIEQCMDLCRMKNMVSWPVPKADLASKGNMFMVSELLVMTGNVGVPHDITKVVRSFDAIRRRIDMLVEHTVLPEYLDSTGRLDKVKVSSAFPTTYVDGLSVSGDITPVFRFTVTNNQGQRIMNMGTYTDLVKLAISMKTWEQEHEQAVIRSNYLRAGLDVHGLEKEFVAQMWKTGMFARPPPPEGDAYAGDLLFESDVRDIATMLTQTEQLLTPPHVPHGFTREGFLTEEERMEIFATIAHEQTRDETWSGKMKSVYDAVTNRTKTVAAGFMKSLGTWVDQTREQMNSSLMFKVGTMITIAISCVSLILVARKMCAKDDKETVVAETSGDEKTRQTRTKFNIKHQSEVDKIVRRTIAQRIIHGDKWVAVDTSPRSTTWVPEGLLKNRRPLQVDEILWTDEGNELPQDVYRRDGQGMVAQACPDRNAYNLGVNRVTNNSVVVQAYEDGRIVSKLRGLFVYGRVLMLPNHFFHGLDMKDTEIEIINSHGLVLKFNTNECARKTPKDEMDVTFLRLPKRFQCYADIRSHFHTVDGLNKFALREAMLWVIDGENNGKMIALCDHLVKDTVLDYSVVSHDIKNPDTNIHLVKSYVYHGVTLAGYCGAPLIWLNPSVQGGHILGIHVAGTNLRGVSTPITREFLYEFLRDWNDISIQVPLLDHDNGTMTAQSKRAVDRNLGLAHYGRVAPSKQVRLPTDTNIIQSPLFGVYEPVTGPAVLCATKTMNPLRTGILKQKVPLVVFPQHIVDAAVEHLSNSINCVDSPYKNVGVLSTHQALNGIGGDKWIPPMNLHTSAGYPYVTANTSKNGKFDFVYGEPGERRMNEIVAARLEKRLNEARNRTVTMTLFMDILKDERVKLEKIRAGKTRIFNVAPFDLNIAVRMYFQAFAAHLMHNHVYGECAVGINPHSDEWGLMYHHMKNMGTNWLGGDYSNYDKQLSYQLLMAVLRIVKAFYKDEHEDVRECLFETMFSAFHIAEKDVYRVPQGNPSGIVMTSLVNSIVNSLMMRIMYVCLGGSLTTFDDNVRIKTYGDDNIAAISDNIPWFNMWSVSQKFAEFGIVYNQPNKEAMRDDMPYLKDDDVTFLKRGFRQECGRVLAPLNMDSIREMVNWIRRSNDDDEATRANFLAACREMYHHGREQFQQFTTEVYVYAQKCAFKLPYVDYQTSGDFWGAEKASCVNLANDETTHIIDHCCNYEIEETLFSVQSERAPRKTKAVWQSLCELLIIAVIINSTSKTSNQSPSENTSASATNDDNITTRTEITTFSDSSVVTVTSPQSTANVPPTPVDPYMKQTLTEYLSRVYYYSGEWSSSLAPGALIAQITFPNFLFSVPQIWDKLKNFTYFRAGVKIGLRINGSKFHFGQMLVSYTPQYNNTLDLQPATNNIYTASGCPSFTISPSENEVHEFTLPFALPYQYIPLYYTTSTSPYIGDTAFQFGVMNMYVLNPLSNASGVPTPVSYTIFANFVDVDIAGYNPIAYTIPVRQFQSQVTLPATLVTVPPRPSTTAQIDPLPPFSGVEAEDPFLAQKASVEQKMKSEKGIVGGVLESVSTISGALSFIPEIGAVAAGVSAVSGVGAQIANYFGWTNPVSLRAIQPIVKQWTNLVNTHGLVDCQNLALSADSSVSQQCALLGGAPHEMTMLYMAQTPSLLAAGITWSSTDVTNTGLWETSVTPCAEFFSAPLARVFPTHLSWVSRTCQEWRGSIRYHIQITCSQMHVGRLRISFIPLNSVTALSDDMYASGANFILDIQQQTDVSFTMPYVSHQPWMQTVRTFLDGTYSTPNIGTIRISVLNELNHPTVPVPAVYLNVWTSAGPDFQLARPTGKWLRGWWPTTTNDPEPPVEEAFVAQGLTRETIRTMSAPPLIPATGSKETHICVPDEFHHVKDIIMRPSWISSTNLSGAGDTMFLVAIDPFAPVARYTLAIVGNQIDYLSYFRLVFRYCRGSHRAAMIPANNGLSNTLTTAMISNDSIDRQGAAGFVDFPRVKAPIVVVNTNNVLAASRNGMIFTQSDLVTSAVIPYYSTMYAVPNAAWGGSPTLSKWSNYGITPTFNMSYQGKPEFVLAAGDDYELMFLVGPPCLTSNGT